MRAAGRALRYVIVLPLWLYHAAISPLLPRHCRFEPTCSVYARAAILRWGVLWGALLTARRLGRCQPWGTGGVDPVPALPTR